MVFDHEITQAMQNLLRQVFSILKSTQIWVLIVDYFIQNSIKLLIVMSDLWNMHAF